MSVRRLAPSPVQPERFAFSGENAVWAKGQIAKYPPGRQASAVIPLLWKAQEQAGGWVPQKAIEHIGQVLGMPYIRVLEIATFYTMFNLEPVGRHFVQLCGTVPCAVRGAEAIKKVCKARIGPEKTVSADGKFSWLEVECLGACCNAPMVQINNDYYEDLTPENFAQLLDDLAAGKPVRIGPQNGRHTSEPLGGARTLTEPSLYDGSVVGAWKTRFADEETKVLTAVEAAPAAPIAATMPEPARAKEKPPEENAADAPGKRAAEAMSPIKHAGKETMAPEAPATPATAGAGPVSDEHKPQLLTAPTGGRADDLKLIWGVGPKLEEMLHGLGVFHFAQMAAWTDMNLAWVDQNLGGFKGRAVRDKWIEQARKLAGGWRPASDVGEKPV